MNIIIFLCFFLFLYFLIQLVKITLYWLYLIQLKEYRLDRLKIYFTSISGKKDYYHYFNFLKWWTIKRPKFTIRSISILILTYFAQYNFFFYFLGSILHRLRNLPSFFTFFLVFFTFYLLNLLTFWFILLFSFLTGIFAFPIKKFIIYLAAQKIKKNKKLLVIGITGSYGKTSVKEIISFVLNGFYPTLKTPLNCNTEIGIAKFILFGLKRRHRIFVVEMGAYKQGEIERICKIVRPKIGIVTGINQQHVALFGSLQKTIKAKYELIKCLRSNGLAIFNGNNSWTRTLYKKTRIPKRYYGQKRIKIGKFLLPKWQKENLQAAIVVADYLKLPKRKVLARIRKIKEIPLGLKMIRGNRKTLIIDDSYSANPSGFLQALELLRSIKAMEKILITPGIIELGESSRLIHKKIGVKAAQVCTKIFLTKEDFYLFFKEGIRKIKKNFYFEVVEDEVELFDKLKPFLGSKTAILIEGRVPLYLIKKLYSKKND